MPDRTEKREVEILEELLHVSRRILAILTPKHGRRQLGSIKIKFTKGNTIMEGPVVLAAGQSTIASIDYFDQTGAPMPAGFVPPNITFLIDNPALASSTPNSDNQTDVVAYVSAGVANLTASCTSAEGLALTDTETVTCSPVVVPPPVLSSIKINFSAPK
jgi:hypothetical protein